MGNFGSKAVAIALLIVACGSGMAVETTTTDPFSAERLALAAASVEVAMEDISSEITLLGSDTELATEWTDLSDDVGSAMSDLIEDPGSVDTPGMTARIAAFVSRLNDATRSEQLGTRFLGAFETFVGRLPGTSQPVA